MPGLMRFGLIWDDDTIKQVNEIYHDLEGEYYEKRHPEIYIDEQVNWKYIGETFFRSEKKLTVLDIGTGIGFVPVSVSGYLKEGDRVICTDISEKMLKMAESKMAAFDKIRKDFIKADAFGASKMDLKADVITMNSVLHHVPDYEKVLPRLAELVNPGGFFIIMHEKNRLYTSNRSLILKMYQHALGANIFLRKTAKKALLMLGIFRKKGGVWEEFNQKACAAVNARKFFDRALTIEDINAIVDIHDPDEMGEGFDPTALHRQFFPGFKIVSMETYKHLGPWVSENANAVNKFLSGIEKRKRPKEGALFWLVMKKG